MGACTDLIYLAARPYANGEVAFELPLNDATMTNVSHTGTFQGRNGVVKFEGTSFMNGGDGLLPLLMGYLINSPLVPIYI